MPADDFPILPPMPAKVERPVGGGLFASAVAQVAVAASRDNTLPMLTAIRLDTDGVNMTMAATDRYRIAARDFLWHPEDEATAHGAMIPAKVLVDVAKSLRAGEVSICLGGNVAGFESAGKSTDGPPARRAVHRLPRPPDRRLGHQGHGQRPAVPRGDPPGGAGLRRSFGRTVVVLPGPGADPGRG